MEEETQDRSGQEYSPEQENLPPVEAGTDAVTAASTAAEALQQVKAAEVQSLAEVLTRLIAQEDTLKALITQAETVVSGILQMQDQAAAALVEIQQQKEALKNPAPKETPISTPTNRRGLASLLPK